MELHKVDRVSSGAAPVIVSVVEEGDTKHYFFDNLTFYETSETVQLVGSKKRVEVEASDLDSAYSKLIGHLVERAVKAEKEVESLKEEQKTGGSTVILPIESQKLIADEIHRAVLKSFSRRYPGSY